MVHGESLPDTEREGGIAMSLSESSAHREQAQQPWNTLAKKYYKVAHS